MSTNALKVASQEFSVRPLKGKPREDQADAARVYFSSDALQSLGIRAGKPCFLRKLEGDGADRRMGIAWPADKAQNLGKAALQMFSLFKEACGFSLEDKLVAAQADELRTAKMIMVTEVEGSSPFVGDERRSYWEVLVQARLERAKTIFKGMVLDVTGDVRRSFVVASMSDGTSAATLMSFESTSAVTIALSAQELAEFRPNARPKLEITKIAGFGQAVDELNTFLDVFNEPLPQELRSRKGVIVHGASGTGKSFLLDHIEDQAQWPVQRVPIDTKPSQLTAIFAAAAVQEPSVILVDDLDIMISAEKGRSCPFTKALQREMIDLTQNDKFSAARVVVIAATRSSSNELLRGAGLFEEQITLRAPDASRRRQILDFIMRKSGVSVEEDLIAALAEKTHAYTGGDLQLLINKAFSLMHQRFRRTKNKIETSPPKSRLEYQLDHTEPRPSTRSVELLAEDLEAAKLKIRPSAMHDISLQPPRVRWADIGGQEHIKEALKYAVEVPLKYPELQARLGLRAKKGLLLYGPPGCSKTLSAQAMATEGGFNFLAVKGAELLNMYVGESERAVRDIFARARAASPSMIFFDEIEAIGSKREGRNNGVNVLTTLLNEMDGIETLEGVTVLAATNKPEALDLALLRPGRFDDLLYVAPPDQPGREAILRVKQRNMACADDVDIPELAKLMEGHTGAEIVSICQKAGESVIKKAIAVQDWEPYLCMQDFVDAIPKVKMQVTDEMIERFQNWALGFE